MSNSQIIQQTLRQHPLFKECTPLLLEQMSKEATLRFFAAGDTLKKYNERPFLCIILSGEASVHTKDENNDLLLRMFRAGDTFGVANLFGHRPPVTRVDATKPTEAICISEDILRRALMSDGALAIRYIGFLSDRICFLNRRISTLSAGSAERRLAAWLDAVVPQETIEYELPLPMNRLADTLGLGRASLYRAFDELIGLGYLTRNSRKICLPNRDAMLGHYGLK